MKNYLANFIKNNPLEFFAIHFSIWQIINISIYLLSRNRDNFNPLFSNQVYLGFISLSTLLLTLNLILIITSSLNVNNLIKLVMIFIFPTAILYFSMFLNYDFKSLQSLTLLIILLLPLIMISKVKINIKLMAQIVLFLGVINTIYSFLQVTNLIPVAQINERELINGLEMRPTGIFFNAFAMSYASLFFISVGLYLIYSKNIELKKGLFLIISPFISLVLSGTRTSLFLGIIFISVTLIFSSFKLSNISKKYIFWTILILGALSPYILMIIGNFIGNSEWATLNGRTQMWSCVYDKRSELFSIGVGLDNAFPPKYCAESGWFSNLRHPENMFLLAFVESGILGILSYILLFIYTLKYTFQKFMKNNFLPFFMTLIFLLASLIYVPFFHYLPFLPDRPADRGIFNFHLIYFFWLHFLVNDLVLKPKYVNKVRKNSKK